MTARSTDDPRRWSKHVTETSHALDLEPDVFKLSSPRAIAESLKRSADRSSARKADPFRSAMSMLVFYINRAGKNLRPERRATLEKAKDELRELFGRSTSGEPRVRERSRGEHGRGRARATRSGTRRNPVGGAAALRATPGRKARPTAG